MYLKKMKKYFLLLVSVFIFFFLFTGTAIADDFNVFDEDDFRDAVTQINNAASGESHNILLHNDIELTYFTATEHSKFDANAHILCLEYTYSGSLTIKSADEGTPYTIRSNMDYDAFASYNYKYGGTPYNPYSFFKISGTDTTVIFEDIIFDGLGIYLGGTSFVHSNNSTVKNAQVTNCTYSGIRVWYADNSTLDNATVSYCSSGVGGGINVWYSYGLTIKDSDIVNNVAAGVMIGGTSYPNAVGRPHGAGIYMLESIVEVTGDTNVCDNLVDGYQSTPVGGGIFAERTALKISGNTNISDNRVPNQGDVTQTFGGGIGVVSGQVGYAGDVPTVEISGNVLISNNSADRGGGIYSQYFSSSDIGILQISDNAEISDNEAVYGGGIFSYIHVDLLNNSSVSRNDVTQAGGGVYLHTLYGAEISVSGDSGQTVSLSGNSAKAGGAVYMTELSDLSKYNSFKKVTDDSILRFSDNKADKGYLWNLTDSDSDMTGNMAYIRDNLPVMKNTTFSVPFSNAYNNFDIYFVDGEAITPAAVTIQYYADALDTIVLGTKSFNSYEGAELIGSDFSAALGADWLNLYQPAGYKTGALQEILPVTITGDTTLNVLYLEDDGGNSGSGGGSGTGSAAITAESDSEPVSPELIPEPGYEIEEEDLKAEEEMITIVLLFMIAIACYFFVTKTENGNDL